MAKDTVAALTERDNKLISDAVKVRYYPFVAAEGEGPRLRDVEGREYLDFTANWAVANTGYSHPLVRQAIIDQVNRTTYAGLVSSVNEPSLQLAEMLTELVPGEFDQKVWFGLSGSSSNEALGRLLPMATGRKRMIAFIGGMAGVSDGAIEMSAHIWMSYRVGSGKTIAVPYPNPYRPPIGDPDTVAEACIRYLEDYIFEYLVPANDVSAVIVEAVQSDAGDIVPPPEFLPMLAEVCQRHGIYLVVDEIKVGMGRTGEWFAFQHSGVTPDAVVLGKSLGGGMPLSAVVARREILDAAPGVALFSTSGNALSCAAGVGTVRAMHEDELVGNAREVGGYLGQRLKGLMDKHEIIGDVRGLGMIHGLELVKDRQTKEPAIAEAAKIVYRAFELGLLVFYVGTATTKVLEITPPLVLTNDDVDEGVDILDQAIADVTAGKVSDETVAAYAGW